MQAANHNSKTGDNQGLSGDNPSPIDAQATAPFGFKQVKAEQKQGMVKGVFDSVASRYDIMNDAMSFGLHRVWKDMFTNNLPFLDKHAKILDVAGGTGDIARRLHKKTGAPITVLDINEAMLHAGIDRQIDTGETLPFHYVCGNAEALPFADNTLDLYTIAFGLRNVTHINAALREACRVLKPGGQFRCLEFSPVDKPLVKQIYDAYSFHILPKMGKAIAGDADSYQYLAESIRTFPKAPDLVARMKEAGFSSARYSSFTFGVVAMHVGVK